MILNHTNIRITLIKSEDIERIYHLENNADNDNEYYKLYDQSGRVWDNKRYTTLEDIKNVLECDKSKGYFRDYRIDGVTVITCKYCRSEVKPDYNFCPLCGESLKERK